MKGSPPTIQSVQDKDLQSAKKRVEELERKLKEAQDRLQNYVGWVPNVVEEGEGLRLLLKNDDPFQEETGYARGTRYERAYELACAVATTLNKKVAVNWGAGDGLSQGVIALPRQTVDQAIRETGGGLVNWIHFGNGPGT